MKKMQRWLSILVVVAMLLPGVAQATNLEEDESLRIEGANRYETSIAVSKHAYEDGADTVVLATGEDYADALTGTALASKEDGPLLLTKSASIQANVLEEIERLEAKKVIILGGEVAVSKEIADKLTSEGLEVDRVFGNDRYETAIAVAEELGKSEGLTKNSAIGKKFFLVSGQNYKDALSIGPVSAIEGIPVLLTKQGELHSKVKELLESQEAEEVTTIGGPVAVSMDVTEEVEKLGIKVDRIQGDNAIETSLAVAGEFFENPQNIIVASNDEFADGLVGGYLAALLKGPVILTKAQETYPKVLEYITESKTEVLVLGGPVAISNEVVEAIEEIVEEIRQEKEDEKDEDEKDEDEKDEEVDKDALITAIDEAEANRDSVEISEDGTDVAKDKEWVTQEILDGYGDAIRFAKNARDNEEATQQEVDEMTGNLGHSTEWFNSEKQYGTQD